MQFADLSSEIGRDARGLYVLGAFYDIRAETEATAVVFPFIAEKGLKANILRHRYGNGFEEFYVLKRGFWLAYVQLDYLAKNATAIVMSVNRALAEHGVEAMQNTFDFGREDHYGLEDMLVKSAYETLEGAPRMLRVGVIE